MKKGIYGDKLNKTILYLFHYLSLFEIISTASEKKKFIVSDSSRDLVSGFTTLQFQVKNIYQTTKTIYTTTERLIKNRELNWLITSCTFDCVFGWFWFLFRVKLASDYYYAISTNNNLSLDITCG